MANDGAYPATTPDHSCRDDSLESTSAAPAGSPPAIYLGPTNGARPGEHAADVRPAPAKTAVGRTRRASAEPKERLSFRLPASLVAEIRGAIIQVGGPLRLTLDGFAAQALTVAVRSLREAHNAGRPFPEGSRGELRPGRPVGG